jgi:2-methylcitrate dehydratase PrpD
LVALIHHRPQTGLEARFSMEYAMAAGLLDGAVGLSSFLDEAVQRPAIQNFLAKVRASEAGDSLFPRWAEVTLHCKSGVTLRRRVDALRGSAEKPLTADELLAKMKDCYRFGNREIDPEKLLGNAMAFERLAIRDILDVSA